MDVGMSRVCAWVFKQFGWVLRSLWILLSAFGTALDCQVVHAAPTFPHRTGNLSISIPLLPAPTNAYLADTDNDQQYHFNWNAVTGATRYDVIRQTADGAQTSVVTSLPALVAPVGAEPAQEFAFRVRACDASACGLWSNYEPLYGTGAIAFADAVVNGVSSTGSYTVSWPAAAGAVLRYELQERFDAGAWSMLHNEALIGVNRAAMADGNYQYRVRACYAAGCGAYASAELIVARPPVAPAEPTVPGFNNNGAFSINWNSVAGADRYQLDRSIDGINWLQIAEAFTTSHAEAGLGSATYRYRVRACNIGGCSPNSPVAAVTVLLPPVMPTLSAPSYIASGGYTVGWTASATAISYELERSTDGAAWDVRYTGVGLSTAESGLTYGVYHYRLKACNSGGCSAWATATTWIGVLPAPPMNLSAPATSATGSYSVSWTPVAAVSFYELQERMNGGSWTTFTNTGNTESLQGRILGGNFEYRVRACVAQDVCGGYTPIAMVKVLASAANLTSLNPATMPAVDLSEIWASDLRDVMAGDFSVNQSGAATYTVPIAAVIGTAGWTPQIELRYSSQEPNGLLGLGWSIQGLSSIKRCRATGIQDGASKPITWTQSDRFCLDGQRLVLVSGSGYGAVGAVYRGEIDRYFRVTSLEGSPGNPGYFKVEHKDGSVAFYGGAPASKDPAAANMASGFNGNIVSSNGYTYTWGLAKHQDNARNPIWFSYYNDASGYAIREINYAYGDSVGPLGYGAQLIFDYEDRADEIEKYVSGHLLSTKRRLSKVTVKNANQSIREYRVSYLESDPNTYTGPSRLNALRECIPGSFCRAATQFDWSPVATGFSSHPPTVFTLDGPGSGYAESGHLLVDINADGCSDIVWSEIWFSTRLLYAMGNCQNSPTPSINFTLASFDNGSSSVAAPPAPIAADYNADGHTDIVFFDPTTERMQVHLAVSSSDGQWRLSATPLTVLPAKTPQTPELMELMSSHHLVDINGDGMLDLIYLYSWSGLVVRMGELDPSQDATSSVRYRLGPIQPLSGGCVLPPPSIVGPGPLTPAGDVNGDGWMDFTTGASGVMTIKPGVTAGCFASDQGIPPQIDVNADGLVDLIGRTPAAVVLRNTGLAFEENSSCIPETSSGECTGHQAASDSKLVDYNRDGYTDLVRADHNTHQYRVWQWNPKRRNFDPPIPIPVIAVSEPWGYTDKFTDVNGDGLADFVGASVDGATLTIRLANGGGQPGHVIRQFTDGRGAQVNVTYENLLTSASYQQVKIGNQSQSFSWGSHGYTYAPGEKNLFYAALNGRADAPDWAPMLSKNAIRRQLRGPFFAVISVERSAPSTISSTLGSVQPQATAMTSYVYGDGRIEASSRGFLGFHTVQSVNHQTGNRTTTKYRQDFPFIGRPFSVKVTTQAGSLISSADYWWDFQNRSGSVDYETAPYKSVLTVASASQYNSDSIGNELLSQINTYTTYDTHGNSTQVKEETYSGDGVTLVARKQTDSTFGSSDEEQRLGLLARAKITHQRPGTADVVRTVDFHYYGFGGIPCHEPTKPAWNGLLCQEIVEPLKPAYRLTTTHTYDDFGNRSSSTVGGEGVTSRTTQWEHDALGRYRNKTINAKNQVVEHVTARNARGQPETVQGLNGAVTELRYGPLGGQYLQYSNDGAFAVTLRYASLNGCPAGTAFAEATRKAGGAEINICYDRLGRASRHMKLGFGGGWIYTDTEYDNRGRVKHKTEPYAIGSVYFTTYSYDALSRITGVKRPEDSSVVTTATYAGLTTTFTNAKGQQHIERKNAAGEVVEVEDDLGTKVAYSYNADGALHTTQVSGDNRALGVPNGPLTTTLTYDDLGRKIAMNDPDRGARTFTYHRTGELHTQSDASGQVSTMSYDVLGRMVGRIDRRADASIEANTAWVYDTATHGLGQLDYVEEAVSGYIRAVEYDGLGRVAKIGISLSANDSYFQRVSYDTYGRVYQQYDAAGPLSGIQNLYNATGYLAAVIDPANPTQEFYRVMGMSPRGDVSWEVNGAVMTVREYSRSTGRLEEIKSTVGLNNVQQINYAYDVLGNLEWRRDRSGGKDITEAFGYDDLNRLTSQQATGQAAWSVSYDSFGNIKSKTGVGDYSYGSGSNGAGPHAVTTVTPSGGSSMALTYAYDANGNNTAGDNRTLKYTTFDRPYEITKDGHKTEFAYGPDREYFKRVDTRGSQVTTTVYVGNMERVTKSDGSIQLRRYLPGKALLTQTYGSGGVLQSSTTQYLLKDHLGSVDVIVDHTGAVQQAQSFDAWGLRRDASVWTPFTSSLLAAFDHSRTNKGFTGHEMLDEVGIVHMNGRIYEPRLGRFLQADAIVQFPRKAQSYNRYAYVRNNPLIAVDPTGFVEEIVVEAQRFFAYSLSSVSSISEGGANFNFSIPNISVTINAPALVAIGTGEVKAPGTNQENEELKGEVIEETTTVTVEGIREYPSVEIWNEIAVNEVSRGERLEDYFVQGIAPPPLAVLRALLGLADKTTKVARPLLGKSPRFTNSRTNTDLPGDKAVAKSIFRNQTKGQKVDQQPLANGGVRRTTEGAQIRMNPDGSVRLDLLNRGPTPPGRETIHFGP